MRAPSLEDFEALARAAWENMPPEFKALCDDLIIRVADFPSDEVIEELDLETPFDILGLFEGVDPSQPLLTINDEAASSIFHIFRRPVLDYWAENEDMLGDVVSQIMVHEIGHHFGLTDDDMDELEAKV